MLPSKIVLKCRTLQQTSNLQVIGQIDSRFIAVRLMSEKLVVLLDQHAVHERIRLEQVQRAQKAERKSQVFDFDKRMKVHCENCDKACRGAIRFGKKLTLNQCKRLIRRLGHCRMPFQCAHGRPSIMLLCQFE